MLTEKEAKKIGISACIEKLGLDFCQKYEENACTSYGEHDEKMFCSVGIDEQPFQVDKNPSKLVLSESGFQYMVSCDVDMKDGSIEFLLCIVPEKEIL